jgi:integrase
MAKVGAKGRRRRRHAYSDAELAPLQAAAPEPRRTAYAAAGYSGLRRGTLMQLQKQDLDPTGPQPRWAVRGEIMKAGRPLNVPMVPESSDAIRARWEQLPSPTSLLFGTNTERRRVKNQKRTVVPAIVTLVEDLKAAKVERVDVQGRRADFHSFRYTFCRLMGERLPIQKVKALMGHSTIKLTADLYGELGMEDVAEDVWALPPLAAKGSPQGATPVSTPAVRLSSTG